MSRKNDDRSENIARRDFLRGAATLAVPALATGAEAQQAPPHGHAGTEPPLVVRQREPENLESPFSALRERLTPTRQFYVRNHFAIPKIEAAAWRLRVEGAVQKTLELDLNALRQMRSHTVTATMECAGNGRVALVPAARGVQWDLGAVSSAQWKGVPLAAVLEQAGVRPEAVEVILEGADSGDIKDPPRPGGPIHFARSLSVEKAKDPNVLLAYEMNGKPMPVAHGFPLRAIVPGWYGMACVKWLTRIAVVEKPFLGFYQTVDYAYWETRDGQLTRVPITEMLVKSSIARPTHREALPWQSRYRIQGIAWAGEAEIARVEVSMDGGKNWQPARLMDRSEKYLWRFWECDWDMPKTEGRVTLMCRATDSRGRVQQMQRDGNRENYMINHVVPIEVDIITQ